MDFADFDRPHAMGRRDMPEKDRNGGILAVIVLYKTAPVESAAFQTLSSAIACLKEQRPGIHILLYDNAPDIQDMLPPGVLYKGASRNDGLAGAYNFALGQAQQDGCDWMLTLDQDTRLPADFLLRLQPIVARLHAVESVAAIVPHLEQAGRQLSPVRIRPWGVQYLSRDNSGFVRGEIHALNSASLFRVSALKQIGGFDPCFWLDYQDAYVFRKLHQCGRRIYVTEDIRVEHDLSLLSKSGGMGAGRFRNFLQAESAFSDLYRGRISRAFLTLRLMARLLLQRKKAVDPAIRGLTLETLRRRIFHSREQRIREWRKEMERRAADAARGVESAEPSGMRPSISVCMAAYNGERYIIAQLQSILSQLSDEDEVIVVDDASRDHTCEKVRSLKDVRVRLIQHEANQGISRTFEDAIRAASGRILFLSDQDDLWDPRKVSIMMEAFKSNPEVTLIATDNALIDENGALISSSYFTGRGGFQAGLWANLVRSRFGGCTMAFRAEVIGDFLPLPHAYAVLHDLWIGVRNSLAGHKALYIPESLVLSRRHSATATGRKPLSLRTRLRNRVHLLLALMEFRIRRTAYRIW